MKEGSAQRPFNSRLDTEKLRSTSGLVPPHWQAGVERMLVEMLEAQTMVVGGAR
jgi:dTDP-4-dehydrorhamnose reductase